jgi:phospholipid/cholesterol/gamma-HCH transport system substrate-binding protein
MSPYRRNVIVGATVLLALGVLAWMMLQFGGNVISPFTAKKIKVMFVGDRADGLADGSPVVYRGVNVGQVIGVRLDEHDSQRIHVIADVTSKPPLPGNLRAYIKTTGLIGGGAQLVLELDGDHPQGQLSGNQEIQTRFSGLSDFIPPEFGKLADELRKTSQQFRESKLVEHLDEQVQHAGKMMDSVQQMVDDPKMRKDIQDSIANMRTATETVNRIGDNIEKFTKNLDKMSANASGAIDDARGTLQKAQAHIDDLSQQLGNRLQQLSTLLGQFQSIAGKIDKGEGTAGKLVNDPKLYQSLVDTSRELNTTITDLKRLVEQWEQEGVTLKLK